MKYPRSHTDPLANLVVLSELDIKQHLKEILDRDLPIGSLPTFLHEATHHWCFDSPVGLAMHLLYIKARRSAWTFTQQNGSEDMAWDVLDSVLKYETVINMLQPITEGIALFAEHDAIPGDTNIISSPMQLVGSVYGRGISFQKETPLGGLPIVLAAGRLSINHLRRKVDLLIQPMTCNSGGYLPGYLIIKGLWIDACSYSNMFFDSDFFLQYLCNHIYHDWKLVSLLLDESKKDIGALPDIQNRIATRLTDFINIAVQNDKPKIYERLMEKNDFAHLEIRTQLIETKLPYLSSEIDDDSKIGQIRFKKYMQSLFKEWPTNKYQNALVENDVRDLSLRAIFTLGNATLEMNSKHHELELYHNEELLVKIRPNPISHHKKATGKINIDIISSRNNSELFLILSSKNEILCPIPIGNYKTPSFLNEIPVDRKRRESLKELSQNLIQKILKDLPELKSVLEMTRKGLHLAINEFYLGMLFYNLENSDRAQIINETKTDGLLPILDDDIKLVFDTAAISLCFPLPGGFNAINHFHSWSTGSLTSSIKRINHLTTTRLGWPGFAEIKDHVISAV